MAGVAGVAGDFATSYIEAVLYSGGQPEQWIWNAEEFEPWLSRAPTCFRFKCTTSMQSHRI